MNALTTITTIPLMDPSAFDHMQRVGAVLANSPLFPDHLRKGNRETAVANGVLVVNMALRLNEDPLTVAQNIYFVGGKPGWSASYMISKANQHGVFKNPIDWSVTGEGDDLAVTAKATLSATGKEVSARTSMEMAKAEGWTKNAKYKSMPEQMLRYRSATFLIRLYCPEVMVGVPSTIEIETGGMKDITPAEYDTIYQEPEDSSEDDAGQEQDAKPEPHQDAKPKPEAEEAPKPAQDTAPKVDAKHQDAFDEISGNLADGAPVSGTQAFYAQKIAAMEAEAPDLHKDLLDLFAQYEKEAAQ